jgi:hypothetical protein
MWAFCSRFGVRTEDIMVARSPPGDFLVTFTHRHHREAAVAARDILHSNLDFRIRPWQLVALGERHDLYFHVRLCLEGIPPHAWNENIAKRSVARACVLDYVEEDCLSSNKADARCLNLWAWTGNPSDIPKIVWLTITGRTMVIHDNAPLRQGSVASPFGCWCTLIWWRAPRGRVGGWPLAHFPGAMVWSMASGAPAADMTRPRQITVMGVAVGTEKTKMMRMVGVGVGSKRRGAGVPASSAASPARHVTMIAPSLDVTPTTGDPTLVVDATTMPGALAPTAWPIPPGPCLPPTPGLHGRTVDAVGRGIRPVAMDTATGPPPVGSTSATRPLRSCYWAEAPDPPRALRKTAGPPHGRCCFASEVTSAERMRHRMIITTQHRRHRQRCRA